ncbi:MAG: hypothetical protein Q8L30_02440 [bacterium]|nr:hypothetical protein [bacterium]
MVTINLDEIRTAVKKMGVKTGSLVNESLALSLAFKVKEFMENGEHSYPFPEALRYALNALYIPYDKRQQYRAVMGSYFGTHGAYVTAQNKAAGTPARQKAPAKGVRSPEIIVERNGQLAFRM